MEASSGYFNVSTRLTSCHACHRRGSSCSSSVGFLDDLVVNLAVRESCFSIAVFHKWWRYGPNSSDLDDQLLTVGSVFMLMTTSDERGHNKLRFRSTLAVKHTRRNQEKPSSDVTTRPAIRLKTTKHLRPYALVVVVITVIQSETVYD